VINQFDFFWITLKEPRSSEPGYQHLHVIIQNNLFNRSLINTVVVCALTSNLKRAKAPGNILLDKGEANMPKKSVIYVSQIFTEIGSLVIVMTYIQIMINRNKKLLQPKIKELVQNNY